MKHYPEDFVQIEERISALESEVTDIMKLVCGLIEIVKLHQEQFGDLRKLRELEKSLHRIEHLQKHG